MSKIGSLGEMEPRCPSILLALCSSCHVLYLGLAYTAWYTEIHDSHTIDMAARDFPRQVYPEILDFSYRGDAVLLDFPHFSHIWLRPAVRPKASSFKFGLILGDKFIDILGSINELPMCGKGSEDTFSLTKRLEEKLSPSKLRRQESSSLRSGTIWKCQTLVSFKNLGSAAEAGHSDTNDIWPQFARSNLSIV